MAAPERSPALPWALIASAALAMFSTSSSGNARAPFLLDLARDFDTSLALAANLMAMNAVSWGIASLVAGAWSDRIGRRPFLIGGPVALAISMAGIAAAESYAGIAFWATAGGAAAGSFSAAIVTEVSSRVENRQRGRALGWALSGQSMAVLIGTPMAAFLGAMIGWRGVHLCVGAVTLGAAFALLLTTRRPASGAVAARRGRTDYRAALSPRVLRLLLMGVAERSCYALAVTSFATYLQASYALPVASLAIPLAVFASGNILGTLLGGQLADRLPNRLVTYAGAMVAGATVAVPLFLWPGGVTATVLLGFGFIFCTSVARPCLMAALSNVPDEIRGTVLGLNVTSSSVGWLGAAALGGLVIGEWGFPGFVPMAAGFGLAGAALAFTGRRQAG